jgi:signal transduction histidine kinase
LPPSSSLRILLVEDNPADARLTRELLRESGSLVFELVHVATLRQALSRLGEDEFAVVLLDLSLGDAQGLDTVRRLHQHYPRVAIIVLSGLDDEELAVEALHNGAQDYLVKGQGDGHLIGRAIRYAIERKRSELQLTEARDLAEAASRAKSAFLANMSHELRTPLNAVIGFSEIIANGLFGPEKAELYCQYAGYINSSGRHLLKLVNEILDLSKFMTEQVELTESSVELAPLIGECLEMMAPQIDAKSITVETSMPRLVPVLTADALRLKQILLNLLSNAVKFSAQGGSVAISLAADEDEGLAITVSDRGIGMRPEDIPIALEPFRQIDNRLSRAHEGTGLGLPLANLFAERHGGSLEITSRPSEGTSVRVVFPAWRLVWPRTAALVQSA